MNRLQEYLIEKHPPRYLSIVKVGTIRVYTRIILNKYKVKIIHLINKRSTKKDQ